MAETLGIDDLKQVFVLGIKVGKDLSADLKDGALSFSEGLSLALDFSTVPDLLAKKEAIIAQAKDLSVDEVKELTTLVEGSITNQDIVDTINDGLALLQIVHNLVVRFGKPAAPAPTPTA